MEAHTQKLAQRKLRNAKYAIEDFNEAINGLHKCSLGHGFLLSILTMGLLFGAQNITNILFCTLTMLIMTTMSKQLPFKQREAIYFGMGIYLFLVILEYLIGGIPDPLIPTPELKIGSTRKGLVRLVSGITPYIYLGCRLAFVYVFIILFNQRKKLEGHSAKLLEQLNFRWED